MTVRLSRGGHDVVVFDVDKDAITHVSELADNASGATSLAGYARVGESSGHSE